MQPFPVTSTTQQQHARTQMLASGHVILTRERQNLRTNDKQCACQETCMIPICSHSIHSSMPASLACTHHRINDYSAKLPHPHLEALRVVLIVQLAKPFVLWREAAPAQHGSTPCSVRFSANIKLRATSSCSRRNRHAGRRIVRVEDALASSCSRCDSLGGHVDDQQDLALVLGEVNVLAVDVLCAGHRAESQAAAMRGRALLAQRAARATLDHGMIMPDAVHRKLQL